MLGLRTTWRVSLVDTLQALQRVTATLQNQENFSMKTYDLYAIGNALVDS